MNILDNDVLVNLFVSTQKNNLDLCIEQAIKLVIFQIYIFTLKKIHRSIWEYGSFLLSLNRETLIKHNIEKMSQSDILEKIVTWFPNFWVKKLIVIKEKWAN